MEGSIDGIRVNAIISYKWDHTVLAFKIKMLNFFPFKLSEEKEMGEVDRIIEPEVMCLAQENHF